MHEKKGGTAQPRDERSAEDKGSGTVLDYLWNTAGDLDPAAGGQTEHVPPRSERGPDERHRNEPDKNGSHRNGQTPHAADPHGSSRNMPSGEELRDALTRYANWLDTWSDRA